MSTRIFVLNKRGLVLGSTDITGTKWVLGTDGLFKNVTEFSVPGIEEGIIADFVIRSGDRIVSRADGGLAIGKRLEKGGSVKFSPGGAVIAVTAFEKKNVAA